MLQDENTILTAAINNDTETLQKLLDNGVDVNTKDCGGNTPLIWAAWYGHIDIVKLLLDNGAEVNVKNNFGDTTLALAEDVVADLLKQAYPAI